MELDNEIRRTVRNVPVLEVTYQDESKQYDRGKDYTVRSPINFALKVT